MKLLETELDREANYFARCLLMPREFLLKDIDAMGGVDLCDDRQTEKLAQRYQVSISMMALRLAEILKEVGKL